MNMNKKHNTRDPKQERSKESRNNIIAAGLKLFSEKGYYKTNSKEIAKKAGVSIGSFYMYFKDKKDLFKEVLVDYHEKIRAVLENIEIKNYIQADKGKVFLLYLIHKLIEAHNIYPKFHQEINVMALSDPDISKIIENSKHQSIELTKVILYAWKDKLRIKDIDAAAIIVQITTEEMVHALLFSDSNTPGEKIIEELTDMLYRYLYGN
jgi:AcrR family transcriptional regulator